jgi:hypothetical protein
MASGKVTFDGFAGYYGYMSNYNGTKAGGGFDWSEVYFFTSLGINTFYPDEHTGYNNDLHGTGVGFSLAEDNTSTGYGWGSFYSPTKETFTLKSADLASAWDDEQSVKFTTYKGKKVVGTDYITVAQTGQKVDFAKYGKDFTNITKVRWETNNKYATNTSSVYGKGWQIVWDDIKATWSGKRPGLNPLQHNGHHVAHGVLGAMADHAHDAAHSNANHGTTLTGTHYDSGFHSAITSLDGALGHHSGGSLTSEFHFA